MGGESVLSASLGSVATQKAGSITWTTRSSGPATTWNFSQSFSRHSVSAYSGTLAVLLFQRNKYSCFYRTKDHVHNSSSKEKDRVHK